MSRRLVGSFTTTLACVVVLFAFVALGADKRSDTPATSSSTSAPADTRGTTDTSSTANAGKPDTAQTAPAKPDTTDTTAAPPPPPGTQSAPPGEVWEVYVRQPYRQTAPVLLVFHDRGDIKLEVAPDVKLSSTLTALDKDMWARVRVAKNTVTRVENIVLDPVVPTATLGGIGFAVLLALIIGHKMLLGIDGPYSKSQFQIAIWFGVLLTSYVAACITRAYTAGAPLIGGVNIPAHLLVLSGISAFTFGAAKGIRVNKENAKAAAAAAVAAPGAPPPGPLPKVSRGMFYDLVHDDAGNPDLGDVQMLVLTLIAVVVYLVQVWAWLRTIPVMTPATLPDVDTTILSAVGLGQGAYLFKKQVSG